MNYLLTERIAKKQMDLKNIVELQERHKSNHNLLQVTIIEPQIVLIKSEIVFLQSILQEVQV